MTEQETNHARPMVPGIALALCQNDCSTCLGLGMSDGRGGRLRPCGCVYRAVFRACFGRFKRELEKSGFVSRAVVFDPDTSRPVNKRRPRTNSEDYLADFVLIAQRTLDTPAYDLFRYHYLLGADWRACAGRLGINRGAFFHECYRVQRKLGRAYWETRPYALYPIDEYFSDILAAGRGVVAA